MNRMIQIKWKLLVTYLVVAAVVMSVIIIITRQLTIQAYGRHVHDMQGTMGSMMSGVMTDFLNETIRDALNSSLIWGGVIAVTVAVVISIFISRKITSPIHEMAAVSGRIAEGDYSRRVEVRSRDEIGSLAESFNRMAESLEEAQRLRRELMANIAHELRTPLTSISGYMEGLADGVVPASAETYDLVHREAGRLSRLVDDLQRLSRAESGKEKLDLVELQTVPFLERVIRRLAPQFNEKGVRLELRADADLPAMLADEDRLDQVLFNLLGNGLNYTDTGGSVVLGAALEHGEIVLSVADSGIGISAEDLPHIFERFYRADKSRSRERGGTGIGLTIAERYVQDLGGSIAVSSEPGAGTRFTVRIPAVT